MYLVVLLVGFSIGLIAERLYKVYLRVKELEEKKPVVGATEGAYWKTNEFNVNQGGDTGLVAPKTPQQLEWEEAEKIRQMQYKV